MFEIEHHRPLAPVVVPKVERALRMIDIVDERSDPSSRATAGRFDLDDIRAEAGQGQAAVLGLLVGEFRHLVEIDALVVPAHLIGDNVVCLAGKVQFVAMRQVPAVRQVEPHDGIARR